MVLFITTIHIIIAILLILFVLLQDSKGGAMGMMGGAGGGSNTLFGAGGASNFLVKVTRWIAVAFAVTCVSLTYMTSKKSSSVLDDYVPAASAPAEAPAEAASTNSTEAPATEDKNSDKK